MFRESCDKDGFFSHQGQDLEETTANPYNLTAETKTYSEHEKTTINDDKRDFRGFSELTQNLVFFLHFENPEMNSILIP